MSEISPSQLLAQLQSMAASAGSAPPAQPAAPKAEEQPEFARFLMDAIDNVNDTQQHVSQLKEDFQLGRENVDISQVMIASQKASVEFQLMMNVRNKLVDAYKDIMNMSI